MDGIREFADLMGGKNEKQSKRANAIVTRIDDEGTVWVHLDGGVDETPVHSCLATVKAGDAVPVTFRSGRAEIGGNASDLPASSARVDGMSSIVAQAQMAAARASVAAGNAEASADAASTAAQAAQTTAGQAATAAAAAQTSANNAATAAATADGKAVAAGQAASAAQTSANKATYALSEVENVVGTLNWIAEHGTYSLTEDTSVVPGKVYYTRSGTSPDYTYAVVADPVDSELSTYYELELDESVQNFLAAHVWVDSNGLNVASDNTESGGTKSVHTGWRIGSVFELIRDGVSWFKLWVENNVAKLRLGKEDSGHIVLSNSGMNVYSGIWYIASINGDGAQFGNPQLSTLLVADIKNRGVSKIIQTYLNNSDNTPAIRGFVPYQDDYDLTPRGLCSTGTASVAFGKSEMHWVEEVLPDGTHQMSNIYTNTKADGDASISVGVGTETSGDSSAAFGCGLISSIDSQSLFGKYNVEDTSGTYALIIGNGTSETTRSNALAVRWNGLVDQAGETAYPTFIRSSWSTSSDESTLPVTPCFVLDTSTMSFYWCNGQ